MDLPRFSGRLTAGAYTFSDGSGYATLTAHTEGLLDGSDTAGCVLNGNIIAPDLTKNYYNAVADFTTCGSLGGHYTGILTLGDGATPNDNAALTVFLYNAAAAIIHGLAR